MSVSPATRWQPPSTMTRDEIVRVSDSVLALPDYAIRQREDIFRIHELGMDWDIGVTVYEPESAAAIPTGADGQKIGIFLLHGAGGDWRNVERTALFLVRKFAVKVVSLTYPGRLYLPDPSRDWPGDSTYPDGTVRTPIWQEGEYVTPDQYDVIHDRSMRAKYGTRVVARAKPGTRFYDRMASWPVAFEEGMKEACRRHLPLGQFSIYVHAHSAGGPMGFMLLQRVQNIRGAIAMEDSPFGYITMAKHQWSGGLGKLAGQERAATRGTRRSDPFNELYIYDWKYKAQALGPIALASEGPAALMRLPWLMETVFEEWDRVKTRPQFKTEYPITHEIIPSLTEAAQVAAKRLGMNADETAALVARYVGYSRELSGPGVKPMPPVLFAISENSRDHSREVYEEVILPAFRAMKPAPKLHLIHYLAGAHIYMTPEEGLPAGIGPAVTKNWIDAIREGFFLTN